MDETVTGFLPRRMRMALLGALCVLASAVHAQGLPDPTRPPASLQRGAAAGAGATAPLANLPQLQSILIGREPGGRHVAVIDGQTLRLGEHYKGAVLTRVTDTEVELRQGAKRQVLTLYPATPTQSPEAR
jgi:MSHA biogenesis protein MshK